MAIPFFGSPCSPPSCICAKPPPGYLCIESYPDLDSCNSSSNMTSGGKMPVSELNKDWPGLGRITSCVDGNKLNVSLHVPETPPVSESAIYGKCTKYTSPTDDGAERTYFNSADFKECPPDSKIILIVLVVLAALVLAFVVYYLMRRSKKTIHPSSRPSSASYRRSYT